jgi:DNA-directed RNA polymerase subunit M/transcription elongation factor TFIIS
VRRVTDGDDRLVLEQGDGNTIVYHDRAWLSYVAGADVEVSATPGVSGSPTQVGQDRHIVSKGQDHRLSGAEPSEQPSDLPGEVTCSNCGAELGEVWARQDERAQERGEHPAPCPSCGGNPLPPVGDGEED